jgi:hypothetical protein
MVSQDPYFFLQFVVVSHHCASFAEGPQILTGVEAKAGSAAEAAVIALAGDASAVATAKSPP